MKTTAVYLRVSTADQTLNSQRGAMGAISRQRGWGNVTVYEDTASGADAGRPALARLMADIRRARVSQVVVFRLDRLGISLPHLAQIIVDLDSNHVGLLVPDQVPRRSQDATPSGPSLPRKRARAS